MKDNKDNKLVKQRNAGFGIRLVAYLIDWILLWMPFLLIGIWLIVTSAQVETMIVNLSILFLFGLVISGISSWIYFSLTATYWGGSLGKLAFGLEIINEEGDRVSLGESLFRFIVGYTISTLALWLGFLWIIRDKENRGWHDLLAGTRVIIKEENVVLGVLFFLSLLLLVLFFLGGLILRLTFFFA